MFSKEYGRSKIPNIQHSKLRNSLVLEKAAPQGNMDVLLVPARELNYSLRKGKALVSNCFSDGSFALLLLHLQTLMKAITVCGRKAWAYATAW